MVWTTLVTLLAIVLIIFFTGRTGMMRGKLGIAAPATSGHPQFERANRIHANTVEQAVIFFPALWLAAHAVGDVIAAALGALWIVGRLIYSSGYMNDPKKRGPGMMITVLTTVALVLAGFYGVAMDFMA